MTPEELFETGLKEGWAEKTLYKLYKNPKSLAKRKGLDTEDLLQYALTGLWIAATTYDESKNTSFKTHAINNIRWHLTERVKRECNPFKLNANTKYDWDKMHKIVYMDKPMELSGSEVTLHDLVSSDTDVEGTAISDVVESEILSKASPEQLEILRLYIEEDKSYKEIGELYDRTGANMSAKVRRLRDKLKHYKEEIKHG